MNEKFVKEVLETMNDGRHTLTDAVIEYHHKHNVEIETIAAWVRKDPMLKDVIHFEGIKAKMVRP